MQPEDESKSRYALFESAAVKRFFNTYHDHWDSLEPSVPSRETIIAGSCEILAAGAEIRMAA